MPVTESDRPHNKQNNVEKRAVEGASPYIVLTHKKRTAFLRRPFDF